MTYFLSITKQPILSDFCKALTTIQQEDVDNAAHFNEVINDFQNWIDTENEYRLCSWGFYDRKQFENDCAIFGLDTEWLRWHISLKHQYWKIKALRRKVGLKAALAIEGFEMTGIHHRGIDDARNIAKIFEQYFNQWDVEVE